MYKKISRCTIVDFMKYALATYFDEYYNLVLKRLKLFFCIYIYCMLQVYHT